MKANRENDSLLLIAHKYHDAKSNPLLFLLKKLKP